MNYQITEAKTDGQSTALAPETDPALLRNDWSVLTKSRNGTISLIRYVNLGMAVRVYDAAEEKRQPNTWYYTSGGDIVQREILGPADWDGCKKAMKHDFPRDFRKVESGPMAGRQHQYTQCKICGEWGSKWLDEQKE